MSFSKSPVKVPLGMRTLDFWPIVEAPAEGAFTYGASINLGAAVKGYLTISANPVAIPGDDVNQIDVEVFAGAQLDSETTLSDLQINSKLFGHEWDEESGEISKTTDCAGDGGVSFIEPILRKDKTVIYRATCLLKCTPLASSEKQEADTRKPGELNPKMNAVSFKVSEASKHTWRFRKDFETEADAVAFINETFGAAT